MRVAGRPLRKKKNEKLSFSLVQLKSPRLVSLFLFIVFFLFYHFHSPPLSLAQLVKNLTSSLPFYNQGFLVSFFASDQKKFPSQKEREKNSKTFQSPKQSSILSLNLCANSRRGFHLQFLSVSSKNLLWSGFMKGL